MMNIAEKTQSPTNIERIASRLGLTAAQKQELQKILTQPVHFIRNSLFSCPKQMQTLLQQSVEAVADTLLDGEKERVLFLQMNYALYRLQITRRKLIARVRPSSPEIQELLKWNQIQQIARDKIIAANMGLILSMAKHVQSNGMEFTDLVSEGSIAMLQAVKGYDCERGYKFSTYACRVILRRYWRVVKKHYTYSKIFSVSFDPARESFDRFEYSRGSGLDDMTHEVRYILNNNLADLSPTEQSVINLRFFPVRNAKSRMTLKQVGQKLGLTKERIRQIQLQALAKLREIAEQRMASV
jgi:RNA polymerase primary sigma factor